MRTPGSAGGCSPSDTRSTPSRAPNGSPAVEAELAAMPEVRIMRRTTVTGVFDHGQYGAVERVSDHFAVPPPHQPRQRSGRSSRSAPCSRPARSSA